MLSKVARMVEENKQLHHRVEELTTQSQLNQDMFHRCSQILSDKDAEIADLEHLKNRQEEIIFELNGRLRNLTLRDKDDDASSEDAHLDNHELTARLLEGSRSDERLATDTIVEQEHPGYDADLQNLDQASQGSIETQNVHAEQDPRESDAKPKYVVCVQRSSPNGMVPGTAGSVLEVACKDRGQSSLPSSFKRGKDWEGMTWSFPG
jgi:hypothetical protein